MNTVKTTTVPGPFIRLQQYFLDLDLEGPVAYGYHTIIKRNLWLVGCYIFFAMGIFARQIVSYNDSITVTRANFTSASLFGALVVGMALYPFALRTILKLVNWIFSVKPLRRSQGFNIIHLMVSFALGYFFNLVAQNVPVLLAKIGL